MDYKSKWIVESKANPREPSNNISVFNVKKIALAKAAYRLISPNRHNQKAARQVGRHNEFL